MQSSFIRLLRPSWDRIHVRVLFYAFNDDFNCDLMSILIELQVNNNKHINGTLYFL